VGLQVCAIYPSRDHLPEGALRDALLQIAAFDRAVREGDGELVPVRTRADLDGLDPDRRLGLLLSLEGAEPLGVDAELVDVLWELGVRMVALTWNDRNAFADGTGEPGGAGLSRLGRELVDRLVRLGAIIDLAHASERTFFDVLEQAPDAAVVVSHAGCRTVYDVPRNLSDEQLRALAERDGVLGVMAHPVSVHVDDPTLARFMDHVDHAVGVMGAEHVGLGADFIRQVARSGAVGGLTLPGGDALDAVVPGLEGPADYPALVTALAERGHASPAREAICGGNLVRLLRRGLP
jgi:membrane dipeptidase